MKIENTTVIKHAKPICDALNKAGKNWNWEANAALLVRVVLEEMGCVEQLTDEYKADRQAVVKVIEKFGYPKNFQDIYLSQTDADGKYVDGKPVTPMMAKVGKTEEAAASEWA